MKKLFREYLKNRKTHTDKMNQQKKRTQSAQDYRITIGRKAAVSEKDKLSHIEQKLHVESAKKKQLR